MDESPMGQKKQINGTNVMKNFIMRIKIEKMLKSWKKAAKKSRHRVNILKQWATTQQNYINDLQTIKTRIQQPLIIADLITVQQDRILFPNLDAMLKLSRELLQLVTNFLITWNPHNTLIADQLINLHNYFIIYREYCNNFAKAQKIIKQVRQKEQFEKVKSVLPMDIQSYIIKPVQRPPKYQLLLREYQKVLPKTHKDYQRLKIAIQKYHDVNEQNNKSMDLQIRNQRMVQLDKKYGGIISASRVFLFEQPAKCLDFRVKLYFFNDMVLISRVYGEDTEEGYKKIFLNGQSFIDAPMDGKYLVNRLFICGIKQNIHVQFPNLATRDKVSARVQNILHDLFTKQTNKLAVRKKTKTKMNVMQMQQLQIKGMPMLRVTVVGVQKRPTMSININMDTFYILKVQAPFPNIVFQYSYVRLDQLIALQKQIRAKNRYIPIPILEDRPEDMSIYQVKKNKTRIIECRHVYIERFVNYVFRTEELQKYGSEMVKVLKINQDLWKFASYNEPCTCQICSSQVQKMSLKQFEHQRETIKNLYENLIEKSRFSKQSSFSTVSYLSGSQSSCIFNNMAMPQKILQTATQQINTLDRRLTWLQCKLGRIDYSLIPKSELDNNIKVSIDLLSLKQNQNINVKISKKTTVLQVLDQIGQMYKIKTMRDFGLFLDYQDTPRLLDRDERLWEVLNDVGYQMDTEQKQIKPEGARSSLWRRFSSIKKWGEQIIAGKRPKLYIKKYIFFSNQIQINASRVTPERYPLIVEEIFYRIKNQLLILNIEDTKCVCGLYYVLTYMDKLAHLNEANFQVQKLKKLLPESKWHIIQQQKQKQQIYFIIKKFEKVMEDTPLPEMRKSTSTSTLFARIQTLYESVLNLAQRCLGWSTIFFQVENYDPPTLPGNCEKLLLGINPHFLIIIRHKQLQPLVKIKLKKLSFKVTVFSIFIKTTERILRFDGTMMYDIKKLIQIYKMMEQKFGEIESSKIEKQDEISEFMEKKTEISEE